ncbi:hypothetical protein WJX75_006478 [Coccomyxa subellipsoidea]|uniref:Amino acid transporter transmembrane domain-containing protein n=1 Tax=Coccomyxa subellipsoidea TaxID=248742 RepID=A0ABR2YKN3_9CHLO
MPNRLFLHQGNPDTSRRKVSMEGHKGGSENYTVDAMENGAPPNPKILTDEKGFARSDLEKYDDDGHVARTGGWITAYAHIVCAVIGSGVLSLAWGVSWLGWVAGPLVLFMFAWITWYCSALLIDCYRYPDTDGEMRNYTYIMAVKRYLGGKYYIACGAVQYANMVGTSVGYTVTAGIAATAIRRSDCFHADINNPCYISNNPWMILFGALQIIFSQIQDIDRIWWMSIVATLMSFTYSFIGLGECIAQAARGGGTGTGTVGGLQIGIDTTAAGKAWGIFQALGNIAFAYSFSFILIEITDTITSPGECKKMKRATVYGIATTTFFYACIGIIGYAAFGNSAPGNLLSGFGFYNPWWLIDIANAAIFVHLLGGYQVWIQPFFGFVEASAFRYFPNNRFLQWELFAVELPGIGLFRASPFRLIWRTIYVIIITIVAMLLPFFNDIVGLLGSIGFAPLTVFFPIQMHIVQKKIPRWSGKWLFLQGLNIFCWLISIVSAIGSVEGIYADTRNYTPFQTSYRR